MKRYKLKKWVLPTIYVLSISVIVMSLVFIGQMMSSRSETSNETNYVSDEIIEDTVTSVVEVTNETVNHPYLLENVKIAKDYYDKSKTEEEQISSLLYYKNTYMENTGVLYSSEEQFDVVSVLDGSVTSITTDDILGNVIEITHSTELITIYHCLGEVAVNVGDAVKQNDVLGKSGKVNLDKGYNNALLFEVNYKGGIINPNEFYNMKIADLLK